MFRKFSGGGEDHWPLAKVIAALEDYYGQIDKLGEDGPLSAYGVQTNGVNFVVALMQTGPGSGTVAELGFLARFIGFAVSEDLISSINRNLHVSIAAMEGAELYLMAGLEASGPFDAARFGLILEAWRRDLMVALAGLSQGGASMAAAFPAAKLDAARAFAVNAAPAPAGGEPVDLLKSFLGTRMSMTVCDDCGGRGKRGLIARICGACDGSGFVNAR